MMFMCQNNFPYCCFSIKSSGSLSNKKKKLKKNEGNSFDLNQFFISKLKPCGG